MDQPVVDIHAHYLSSQCLRSVIGASTVGDADGSTHRGESFTGRCMDLDRRIEWMKRGIDLQILAPELRFVAPFVGSKREISWARLVNESVAADISERDEFRAIALLPMFDGESAAEELERAIGVLGLRGGLMHSRAPGGLSAEHLEALWVTAAELDVPLLLHSWASSDARLERFDLDGRMGRVHDVGVAAAELLYGAVLERFPDLKIILTTGGGSLPYLIARLDRDHQLKTEGREPDCWPSHCMKRFNFDSLVYGREQLRLLMDQAGPERIMIGSDWPMPIFEEDPKGFVQDACASRLSGEEIAAVVGGNAFSLFSL